MTTVEICRYVFSYFYEKVYRAPCPISTLESDRAEKAYETFSKIVSSKYGNSVDVQYIWNYTLYHFGRYYDKIKKNALGGPTGKITPIMVYGKKPHDVFENRRVEMDFMLNTNPLIVVEKISKDEFAKRKGVQFPSERNIEKELKAFYRDPVKAVASLGEEALTSCVESTDLYNDKDISCQRCKMANECKVMLKEMYPKIYKERNYE